MRAITAPNLHWRVAGGFDVKGNRWVLGHVDLAARMHKHGLHPHLELPDLQSEGHAFGGRWIYSS